MHAFGFALHAHGPPRLLRRSQLADSCRRRRLVHERAQPRQVGGPRLDPRVVVRALRHLTHLDAWSGNGRLGELRSVKRGDDLVAQSDDEEQRDAHVAGTSLAITIQALPRVDHDAEATHERAPKATLR